MAFYALNVLKIFCDLTFTSLVFELPSLEMVNFIFTLHFYCPSYSNLAEDGLGWFEH